MLLNLHCHSNYSDGADSIFDLASACQKAGHIALCLTDHSYMLKTVENWEKQCTEAALVSAKLNFPIIVGIEAYILGVPEEVLIFGRNACLSLLEKNALASMKQFKAWYNTRTDPFALILCHPTLGVNDLTFYLMMDGYEVVNCNLNWSPYYVKEMEKLMPEPRRAYVNQDLHTLTNLCHPCNDVDDLVINDESDLIKYLKS